MRQALVDVDGVVAAEVSYDDARARVRYRPDVVEPEVFMDAVTEAGFDTTRIDDDGGNSD